MQALREQFLLDRTVTFLNHGSFGATPRPVFAAYRRWQRRLERQPVLFLGRQLPALLAQVRRALGGALGANPAELVLLPNATFGVNLVARSLHLGRGDEILTTDHEYGACDKTWRFLCLQSGASYCRRPIPLPVSSPGQLVDGLWDGVTPRTRLIFVSHITSPTALTMPVAEICARARRAGILTLIDGAHAPGQLPLDLHAIDADFYVGNLHKWALAPKGAAFLYARPDRQPLLEPLVVSWGWSEEWSLTGTSCVDLLQWWGTVDPAASLSVPAAIRFQEKHDWPAVRRRCHELATGALLRLGDLTGLDPLYPPGAVFYQQMVAAPLPPSCDPAELQARLYGQHRIEIPCLDWNGRPLIRLSVQGYNSEADIDALLAALEVALPGARA